MFKSLKAILAISAFSLVLGGSHGRPFGTAKPAEAVTGCNLYVKSFVGNSLAGWLGGDKKFTASYLPNSTQIKIEVAPNNCVWRIDRSRAKTASWLTTKLFSGNPQRDDGTFVGSAYIDLKAARNTGAARITSLYFTTSPPGGSSTYDSIRVAQGGVGDYCQPKPTVIGTTQNSIVEPGFLVLTDYGSSSGTPPARVDYRFRDAAGCATLGGVAASTPNLLSPAPRIFLETRPDKFLFQHAGVNLPQTGGAILARLGDTQSIWQGRSAVFVRYLLPQGALPADLRINPETLSQYIVAVSDGGGIVEVTGHAVRSTSNPNRPCAFDPSYYHVVEEDRPGTGIQWLKLISGTGCTPGRPDDGKLMISIYPSAPGVSRLGALYTDWGSAIMIVQR